MLDKIHSEETTYKELSAALVAAAAEATRPEVELLLDDVHDHLLYHLHLSEKCTLPVPVWTIRITGRLSLSKVQAPEIVHQPHNTHTNIIIN